MLALISAILSKVWFTVLAGLGIGREVGQCQGLPLGLSYNIGYYSIVQGTHTRALPAAKYIHTNYVFRDWVNNHRLDPRTQQTPHQRDSGLDFVYLLVSNHSNHWVMLKCWVAECQVRSGIWKHLKFLNISPSPSKWQRITLGEEWGNEYIFAIALQGSSSRGPCFHLSQLLWVWELA